MGDFTGQQLGARYFRGSKPFDAVWATPDVQVVGTCVVPASFGVGDHRLFQVDFRAMSLVGAAPPKIVRAPSRKLNTEILRVEQKYNQLLEKQFVEHQMNTWLLEA